MLSVYTRHYPPCRQTDSSYRRCRCPKWINGTLATGKFIRESAQMRSWETAERKARLMVEGPGVELIRVCLERNAQCFKGSVQLSGRKKPLHHLVGLSEEFASRNRSAGSGRTLLASSENGFIWASLAHIHGIPGMPEWAAWFASELQTHQAIMPALRIGCAPVLIKGEKEQFLDWLSCGVESGAIRLPVEPGSIRWPSTTVL